MVVRKWNGLSIFIGIVGIIMFFAWMFSEREVPGKVIFWGMIGLIMYLSVWFQHLYYALKAQNTAKIVLLIFLPLIGIILCELLPSEVDNSPALPEESSSATDIFDTIICGSLACLLILIFASIYCFFTGFAFIYIAIWTEGPASALIFFLLTIPMTVFLHSKVFQHVLGVKRYFHAICAGIGIDLVILLMITIVGMMKGWGWERL